MLNPEAVVPGSIMPKYGFMFKKSTDLKTAYAEAVTVKKVFNVPYNQPGMPKLGSYDQAQKIAFAQAGKIVAGMKNQDVKDAYKKGDIKEIVALIAYLNSLK